MAGPTLQSQFRLFCTFGVSHDPSSTGHDALITLSNVDKWLKQAGVISGKLTTTDTAIHFSKLKQKKITFKEFQTFLSGLAAAKKMDPATIAEKLVSCGAPGTHSTTKAVASGTVDRLTDTSKYTGSHRERFDAGGHGRGRAGRQDEAAQDGYVAGYKHKDSYDKTH